MLELSPSQDGPTNSAASGQQGDKARAPLRVECLSPSQAEAWLGDWRRLAEACIEPNVFLDPGFALAAARHLAKTPRFLFIWDDSAEERTLVGLCPLAHPGFGEGFLPARLWTHNQAPLGTPLLAAGRAKDALNAIFIWCRTHF